MSSPNLEFGVYLNNRAPLLTQGYGVDDLLRLAELAEDLGLDSVWVGDGLLHEPRHDPLMLLAALSQRTSRVRLGTACLRVSLRDPLYLAMAWATIDHLSGGRTVLGACAGNAVEAGVRREFVIQGLDPRRRIARLEEALHVLRELWTTGAVTFRGTELRYEAVAFFSGTELAPLRPIQSPPPVWIVSNPLIGGADPRTARAAALRAAHRIVRLSDGWLTCCRAAHPEEVEEQVVAIRQAAEEARGDPGRYQIAYQATVTMAASSKAAQDAQRRFVAAYYPHFGSRADLSDWGPVGTADDVIGWIRRFADAGVTRFLFRFGSMDPAGDLRLFANEVLPAFGGERSEATGHAGPVQTHRSKESRWP